MPAGTEFSDEVGANEAQRDSLTRCLVFATAYFLLQPANAVVIWVGLPGRRCGFHLCLRSFLPYTVSEDDRRPLGDELQNAGGKFKGK